MEPTLELIEKLTKEETNLICAHCAKDIKVKEPYEGKRIRCDNCGVNWIISFIPGIGFEVIPEDNVWILE